MYRLLVVLRASRNKDESYMKKFSVSSSAQMHATAALHESCVKQFHYTHLSFFCDDFLFGILSFFLNFDQISAVKRFAFCWMQVLQANDKTMLASIY